MRNSQSTAALEAAIEFLRAALPPADRLTLGEDALARVARHALSVRAETPWGASIPEDVFKAYVLFPRVNNENPEFYHGPIHRLLAPRLAGLDMARAVQEVNRWCFEQATYQSTDARTASALTVMRRGFGRCGEESVLLVSALRACGIPARQIYVPLWSHCDDNHAWVEAWVDGTWRYLGACEPELTLDSGWFTAAASRAMLVHTRAWGALPAGERAETRDGGAWVINRTAAYAPTALLRLRVTAGGAPVPGLRVAFELANMAAFRPICVKRTDAEGRAELLTGLGTLRVRVSDGARTLERDVDVARTGEYTLDFDAARPFAPGAFAFSQRPPVESKGQPADFPPEALAAHGAWLAAAEAARQARFAVPEGEDPLLAAARGNRDVVGAFLADARFEAADKRALLASLREKDLGDVTAEVLTDALEGALPFRDRYPRAVWVEGVLCPRVGNEMLRPLRAWLRTRLPAFEGPEAVWAWVSARLEDCAPDPPGLLPDPRAALDRGAGSPALRDLLFVAACRASGLAARLDPVTGEKAVWSEGAYRALLPARAADARLALENGAGRTLVADVHFSVSALEGDTWRELALDGAILEDRLTLPVPAGAYRVMAVARQIDGSLEGRVQDVWLAAGETRALTLTLPEDRTADKLLRTPLAPLAAMDGDAAVSLPGALAGRPAIVACVAPGEEPTEHLMNELLEARDALAARGVAVRLLLWDDARRDNAKLRRVLAELADARCLRAADGRALRAWREALNARELRLPLAVAIGPGGEGLFAFVNYNVGSVAALIRIIDAA